MTSIAAKAKAAATMTEAITTLLNTSGGAFLTFSLSLLSMGGMFGADWCLNGWSAIAWDSGFVGREHGSASVGTILKQSNKIIIHFNKLKMKLAKYLFFETSICSWVSSKLLATPPIYTKALCAIWMISPSIRRVSPQMRKLLTAVSPSPSGRIQTWWWKSWVYLRMYQSDPKRSDKKKDGS